MPKLTPEQTRFLNTDNGFDCFFNSIIQTKGTDALITGTIECKTRNEKRIMKDKRLINAYVAHNHTYRKTDTFDISHRIG